MSLKKNNGKRTGKFGTECGKWNRLWKMGQCVENATECGKWNRLWKMEQSVENEPTNLGNIGKWNKIMESEMKRKRKWNDKWEKSNK